MCKLYNTPGLNLDKRLTFLIESEQLTAEEVLQQVELIAKLLCEGQEENLMVLFEN